MGGEGDGRISPAEFDIRVVVVFLGDIAHDIHETKAFGKILEFEAFDQRLAVTAPFTQFSELFFYFRL